MRAYLKAQIRASIFRFARKGSRFVGVGVDVVVGEEKMPQKGANQPGAGGAGHRTEPVPMVSVESVCQFRGSELADVIEVEVSAVSAESGA